MKRVYDLVLGLGGACCCSQALRAAGLQLASFPLDWVSHSDLPARTAMTCSGFVGWLPKEALEISEQPAARGVVVRCRTTGLVYPHDFKAGTPPAEQWPAVDEKYRRRADRLMRLVASSRRVLLVWVDVTLSPFASSDDCRRTLAAFRERWPDVSFELLHFAYEAGRDFAGRSDAEADGVRTVAYDYRDRSQDSWLADHEQLGRFLRSEYSVVDYRTDAEKRAWRGRSRQSTYAEYGATNLWQYLTTRLEYKLWRHLSKKLARKGLV